MNEFQLNAAVLNGSAVTFSAYDADISEGVYALSGIEDTMQEYGDVTTALTTAIAGMGALLSSTSEAVSSLQAGISPTAVESASVADTTAYSVAQWFYETITAGEAVDHRAATTLSYAEQAVAAGTIVALFNQLVEEAATGVEDWFVDTATMILDTVQASGVYSSHAVLIQALAEAIVAIELQGAGGLEMISESAEAGEAVTNLLRATQAVLEQIIAADLSTSYLLFVNIVSEFVNVDETVSIWQSLTQSIEEGGSAFVHLTFNGEVYTGWVMNTANGASSEYQGMNFNSLCKIGNRYFGASDTGIHEITGNDDEGTSIATYVQSGLIDFGTALEKTVPVAYLGADVDGRVAFGVSVSEKAGVSTYWYEANRELEAINNVKVPIGKGLSGRYWKFGIASDALSEFDAVTVIPVTLKRRV